MNNQVNEKEIGGSIIKQIDKTLEYYDLCNETRIVIDGSPMRKEYVSYHDTATREAIVNCYCHRDYNRRSNIKIEFFDDRCEIISPGGFYGGLTLEDALNGVQSFRNKFLVKLLHKLGYIENYSSGLDRIFKEYKKDKEQPAVKTSLNMFKVTFPNLNYKFNNYISGTQNGTQQKIEVLISLIKDNNKITRKELAEKIGVSVRTLQRILNETPNIKYVGVGKSGHWEIIE